MYANEETITKYLTWETNTDLSQTEKAVKEFYMNNPGVYAIKIKSENRCIGCIDLRLDVENNKGSFGYVLNKDYWN
ncbi:MAG: GNAT family N-acetyltransferase [Gudongella sp.]|nr:GNAT family N-acetyltransferase [Gudongella sp.]